MSKSVYAIVALTLAGKPLSRNKFYQGRGKLVESGAEARHYASPDLALARINHPGAVLNKQYPALSGYTFGVAEIRPQYKVVKVVSSQDIARARALSKLTSEDLKALGLKA
jgi:hypothetical protein